jgi:hypothetical protein
MKVDNLVIKPIRVCKKSKKPFKDGEKINTLIGLGINLEDPKLRVAGKLLESDTLVNLDLLKRVNDRTYYAISSSENLEDFGDIFYGNIEHFQDCFYYTEEDTLENITFLAGEIFRDTLIFVTEVK